MCLVLGSSLISLLSAASVFASPCRHIMKSLLLPRKPLVEQYKHFRNVKLHIFEVEVVLAILLHFQQIVQLEIQFQKTPRTSCSALVSHALICPKVTKLHTFVV